MKLARIAVTGLALVIAAETPLAASAAGGSLAGRVVDGTGQPVEGARVHAWATTPSVSGGGNGRTGADGRFEIEGLADGTVTLEVQAHGYPAHRVEGVEIARGRVQEPLEIRLERAEVSGRVLAPDGTPAAGVGIVVRRHWTAASLGPDPVIHPWGLHPGDNTQTRTDDRGEFVLRGLGLGPVVLVAESESLGDAAVDLDLSNGVNPVELTLDPSGRIQGRVVDARGEPVASARVRVSRDSASGEGSDSGSPPWPARRSELGSYSTGEDGRFLFRRLSPGEYRLEAIAHGLLQRGSPETVTAGKTPMTGIELVMETGEAIVGQLLGLAADQPLGMMVLAQRPGREAVGSKVDEQGRFPARRP